MAKFRRNHSQETRGGTHSYARAAIFAIVLIGVLVMVYDSMKHVDFTSNEGEVEYQIPTDVNPMERLFLPAIGEGEEVIHHSAYSLSYAEPFEQARWVAYELTRQNLQKPNVERTNYYNTDPAVSSYSARHSDYTRSGYTRGHLAPAGDMAQSKQTMEESFFMSNMSPQLRAFNNGIWRELEEQVRDWAYNNDRLFITTGPVLSKDIQKYIGKNQVAVPGYFYKVILDVDQPEQKGIAFIIPHEKSDQPLATYAMTIESAEAITGIDFYSDLLAPELEAAIESRLEMNQWPFDEERFQDRVQKWNNQ